MPGYVTADAKELESEIAEAKANGMFGHWPKRSGIKIPRDAPKLAVCIPMGVKDDPTITQCEKCNHRQAGAEALRVGGMVPMEFALSLQQIVSPLLVSMHYFFRKSIPSARAREQMTHEAIKAGCEYIFYLDDDILLQPHAIYDMYNLMERQPDIGIISGVYYTRQECPEPIVYQEHGDGAFWDFSTERGVLEPIFGAGAGCMMARTEALRDVERLLGRPFWDDEHDFNKGKRMWGHDIRFCRRMHETAALYNEAHDIGHMTKHEAVRLARHQLAIEHGEETPMLGIHADEMMRKARAERSQKLIEGGSAQFPWGVYLAGWIQCYHWDTREGKAYAAPADAPCFKNSNTRGYWDNLALIETKWSELGIPQIRGTETYVHPLIEEMVEEGSTVVDIGCYTGALGDRLIKKKRVDYLGMDISPQAIEILKRKHMAGIAADIGQVNVDFEGDETVVCLEVLEHLDDARLGNALTQIAKAKRAIITVPKGEIPAPHKEHVREFTAALLKKTLEPYFRYVRVKMIKPHYLLADCSHRNVARRKKKKSRRR